LRRFGFGPGFEAPARACRELLSSVSHNPEFVGADRDALGTAAHALHRPQDFEGRSACGRPHREAVSASALALSLAGHGAPVAGITTEIST
jgi:hypothetical protein